MKTMDTVLSTVNAPYSEQLDGEMLANCVKNTDTAKSKSGHMSCFFGEVAPDDQKAFAKHYDIAESTLHAAANAFANYSGQSYPLAV